MKVAVVHGLLLVVVLIDELSEGKCVREGTSFDDRSEFSRVDLSVLVQVEHLVCFLQLVV